jgi:hypothetical protein
MLAASVVHLPFALALLLHYHLLFPAVCGQALHLLLPSAAHLVLLPVPLQVPLQLLIQLPMAAEQRRPQPASLLMPQHLQVLSLAAALSAWVAQLLFPTLHLAANGAAATHQ